MTTHSTLFNFHHTSPSNPLSSSTTTPHLHLSCSFKPKPPKPSSSFSFAPTPIPARDRVIDFGKHKGKMLGTLPSTYLKWVSTNLRARDFEHWAKLADQVLSDAVYRDRIEWESAENALSGNRSNAGGVSELLGISDRFGWDNDDKVGWSKVNFELLGTSKGGRIPRRKSETEVEEQSGLEERETKGEGLGEKRRERRERRMRMQREQGGVGKEEKVGGSLGNGVGLGRRTSKENGDEDNWMVDNSKKFPGRESLLRKAYSRRFL
ncbi:uncharacterized protein LOC133742487 [Rosa rugosa]|uniref:uncharacterized protein LOC133742487 n=1 Tax=Rosa rugosa TaxID=74645 RepID=UPI002B405B46|nr:uncharacterized protein LOC133742487 [Rosa rugosa]